MYGVSAFFVAWGMIIPVICFFSAYGYDYRLGILGNLQGMTFWIGDLGIPMTTVAVIGLILIGFGLTLPQPRRYDEPRRYDDKPNDPPAR